MISLTLTQEEFRQAQVNANHHSRIKWSDNTDQHKLYFTDHYEFHDGSLIYFVWDRYPRMIVRVSKRSYVFYRQHS